MSEPEQQEAESVIKDDGVCSNSEDERESESHDYSDDDEEMKGLSKRARKRLLKHKRWEETKMLKRFQINMCLISYDTDEFAGRVSTGRFPIHIFLILSYLYF